MSFEEIRFEKTVELFKMLLKKLEERKAGSSAFYVQTIGEISQAMVVFDYLLSQLLALLASGDERIEKYNLRELAKEALKKEHTNIAYIGGRIESYYDPTLKRPRYMVEPIEGEIVEIDLEYVPFIFLRGSSRELSVLIAYFVGDRLEVKEIPIKGIYGKILAKLLASQVIPFSAVDESGVTLLDIVYRAFDESGFLDLLAEILEKRRGELYIVPISIAHSIPREALYYIKLSGGLEAFRENLDLRKPISRPILFRPKSAAKASGGFLIVRGEYPEKSEYENFSNLEKIVEELLEMLDRELIDPREKRSKEEILSGIREKAYGSIFSHIDIKSRRGFFDIVIALGTKESVLELSVIELLQKSDVEARDLAILLGCLGAAAMPLAEVSMTDRSLSAALAFVARGFKNVLGSVREAIDRNTGEIIRSFLRRYLSGEDASKALLEARKEYIRNASPLDTSRSIPVLYKIP